MIDAASIGSFLLMWMAIAACGLLAWPLAAKLLPGDSDLGFLAAKPLGWLIGAYAAWLASVAGVPFWRFGWLVGLLALAAVFLMTFRRSMALPSLPRVLQWEAAFLALLLVGAIIKAGVPDIHGLEKFMDFGFVNGALRATTMPPPDPWWAGEPINYYYFGHVAAAWMIQLSGVPSDHGFNLMIAVVFAFSATLSYRIVEGCLHRGSGRIAVVCGTAAAALVVLGGNFHSVLYGPLRPLSWTTYTRDFFHPDSTRFVGFDPPTLDKGFTEMPAYGFAVGDLHAHVLNLPTAFLIALILVRIALREASPDARGVRPLEAAMLALLFAVTAMSNTWDAVSYGTLMGLVGLTTLLSPGSSRLLRLLKLVGWEVLIVLAAGLMAAPFLLEFKPIASSLRWSDGHTPLWQLAVLYGHLVIPWALLLGGLAFASRRDPRWVAGAALAALAGCLIAFPEIAYVKDIYGFDHRRANTMFKLTYQAQPMGTMAAMILIGLLLESRRVWVWVSALVLAIPVLAPLSYVRDTRGWLFGNLKSTEITLDGFRFIDRSRPDDRPLVDWLRKQPADRQIMIVEAPGDSFTETSLFSAMSGVPALLGWRGHERLWRGDDTPVYPRGDEIAGFYNSVSTDAACAFVTQNKVTHVAVGTVERQAFPNMKLDVLSKLGIAAVESGSSVLIEVQSSNCGGDQPSP